MGKWWLPQVCESGSFICVPHTVSVVVGRDTSAMACTIICCCQYAGCFQPSLIPGPPHAFQRPGWFCWCNGCGLWWRTLEWIIIEQLPITVTLAAAEWLFIPMCIIMNHVHYITKINQAFSHVRWKYEPTLGHEWSQLNGEYYFTIKLCYKHFDRCDLMHLTLCQRRLSLHFSFASKDNIVNLP